MLKKGLLLIITIILTSCGAQWKYTTINHASHTQQFTTVPDFGVEVDTLTFSQVRWKLRTDFNFRYDLAQYALSQPASFDWNNRLLGNRYNYNNTYLGYNYHWDRTQMWNDWVWGYNGWNSWGQPHRWSPFGYDRWGYNMHYGWNNHGWGYNNWMGNAHYGWNSGYGHNSGFYSRYRGTNVAYHTSRRRYTPRGTSSSRIVNRKRTTNYNKQQIPSKNDKTVRITKRRPIQTQSSSNGRRSRSRQIIPNKTIRTNRTPNVQPRQVRRRPSTSIPQQSRSSSRSSKQRR